MDDIPIDDGVVEATPEDIACILAWLKREYDEDGEGFWCNHNLISEVKSSAGDLWVIRRDGEAVAFQLGKYSASILSVRRDYRKMGLGTALVQASIKRAFMDNVNALSVQCEPESSLGFWKRMGFVQYDDPDFPDHVNARLMLPRSFELPETPSPIDVVIGFYPESAIYGGATDVQPIAEHHVKGVRGIDGSIMLDKRVIGISHGGSVHRDIAIKIEVDGVIRCFCKGKHEPAKAIGVQRDWSGGTFFIDSIELDEGGD